MEWLSEWIKQILLLVLIATFMDLLLPNPTFDRYVKLVMGLLIIMAILSPVLQWLHQDPQQFTFGTRPQTTSASMDSIDQIQDKSKNLKQVQINQIKNQWEKNMETTMEEQLKEKFSLALVHVSIEANLTPGKTSQVEHVVVKASPQKIHESQRDSSKPVQPIREVEIQEEARHPPKAQTDSLMIKKMKQYLSKTWNLDEKQIEISLEFAG